MPSALPSALNAAGISAALLAAAVGAAYVARERVDPEAIEAAARRPDPRCAERRGYRFPGPDAYPLAGRPWIRSREDLIAFLTRGEDPDVVRRHVEGPEEELIDYLGEVFLRSEYPDPEPSARASVAATPGRPPSPSARASVAAGGPTPPA